MAAFGVITEAFAEMSPGVGYEWDARIVYAGKTHDVPEEIKTLIEAVWSKYNRSPFEKYNRKEHVEPPPKDWRAKLRTYVLSLTMPPELQNLPIDDEEESSMP